MKTIVTFLIALLAFATSVAWAGPEQVQGRGAQVQSSSQRQAQTREAAKAAASSADRGTAVRAAHQPGRNHVSPASSYELELPSGPAVLCACVVGQNLG